MSMHIVLKKSLPMNINFPKTSKNRKINSTKEENQCLYFN